MGKVKTVKLDGWSLTEVYTPDTLPDMFGEFHDIKSLWDSKREPGKIPAWSDFTFDDFDGYYGQLTVEEVISHAPFDAVFRLWGSHWVDVYQTELTGKLYSEVVGPYREEEGRAFWSEMCQTHNIITSSNSMWWLEDTHRLARRPYKDIVLPLGDDGITVDKQLSVLSREAAEVDRPALDAE